MEINKGPDWTATQFTAGAIGFFASAAVAHVLVAQGYAARNWAVILIAIGLCVPPAIVRWLDVRKRRKRGLP
jgi:UDP-N-acetylmuramyl pentapeptide phosphotransferase/UDP-N-acetylglucosamine-1-phosphate transferase